MHGAGPGVRQGSGTGSKRSGPATGTVRGAKTGPGADLKVRIAREEAGCGQWEGGPETTVEYSAPAAARAGPALAWEPGSVATVGRLHNSVTSVNCDLVFIWLVVW